MNKTKLIVAWVVGIFLLLSTNVYASEVIKPLSEKEVKPLLKQLNSQGIVVVCDKSIKEDEFTGGNPENASFYLKGSDSWYFLYRADINNDGKDEDILCLASGSGGFFDIDAVYQEKSGKLTDIFNEIKIPLRKLVREAQKEGYALEEGFSFMNGGITIEQEGGKVFFTLEQTTRKYEGKGFEEDFNPTQGYKFLWDNSGIKLIEHYVGDKIYEK